MLERVRDPSELAVNLAHVISPLIGGCSRRVQHGSDHGRFGFTLGKAEHFDPLQPPG